MVYCKFQSSFSLCLFAHCLTHFSESLSYVMNRVCNTCLVQWLSWVFGYSPSKKKRKGRKNIGTAGPAAFLIFWYEMAARKQLRNISCYKFLVRFFAPTELARTCPIRGNGPGQFLESYAINRMRTIRLVQWWSWVFATQESKKERKKERKKGTCHICLSHVTYTWVMSRMNESCHVWMNHVTYE